jgi:hypothetical protein
LGKKSEDERGRVLTEREIREVGEEEDERGIDWRSWDLGRCRWNREVLKIESGVGWEDLGEKEMQVK